MLGEIAPSEGAAVEADKTFLTAASVFYDAVYVADGASVGMLADDPDAVRFVKEAYKHCKPIAALGRGLILSTAADVAPPTEPPGVVTNLGVVTSGVVGDATDLASAFVAAIAAHRHWEREAPMPN